MLNYYIFENKPLLCSRKSGSNSCDAVFERRLSGEQPIHDKPYKQILRNPLERWISGAFHFRHPLVELDLPTQQFLNIPWLQRLRRKPVSAEWFQQFYETVTEPLERLPGFTDDHFYSQRRHALLTHGYLELCEEYIPLETMSERCENFPKLNYQKQYERWSREQVQEIVESSGVEQELQQLWQWDFKQYWSVICQMGPAR